MKIFENIADLQNSLKPFRANKKIALVPTMGNLHQGHLKLMQTAHQHADVVVASIFVNPLQFGAGEDFEKYPRTFEDDCKKLESVGVDFLFAPNVKTLYPEEQDVLVALPKMQSILEGEFRPTHFQGVATVVLKLFHIVSPDVACFGKKDYQQLKIITHMVRQLALPIEIVGVEIEREADGLALSSRNGYLKDDERRIAPELAKTLQNLRESVASGKSDFSALCSAASVALLKAGFVSVDYVKICKRDDLSIAQNDDPLGSLVVLAAARLGTTRLLDNLEM